MSIYQAFELIENHPDSADFYGGVSDALISQSESVLGLSFPPSYKEFLKKLGAGAIRGIELYGLINEPDDEPDHPSSTLWYTQTLREDFGLPQFMIAISETGFGPIYVIDTSEKDEQGESPVYVWFQKKMEKDADQFGNWLYDQLESMLNEENS
jgi:antitoxin YobK